MANRTAAFATAVHGSDPQNLLPPTLRSKIYGTRFWKEECFGLSAAGVIDKAVALSCLGGTYGGAQAPSRFLCLLLKLLQLQPEEEIAVEYVKADDFKYLRLLGCAYLRLTSAPAKIYTYLEPLLGDSRKVRIINADGTYSLGFVDAVVDELLLKDDGGLGFGMPRLPKRWQLEDAGLLTTLGVAGRMTLLEDDEVEEALAKVRAESDAAAAPPEQPPPEPERAAADQSAKDDAEGGGGGARRLNFLKRPSERRGAGGGSGEARRE